MQLRGELGIRPADFIVGFIGRLVREKGLLDLLEACDTVTDTIPELRLLIVGGTPSSERDQKMARKIRPYLDGRFGQRVVLTGFRHDIPDLISIMDVVVLPSHREGFGMVLAEAAGMGKPVITTDTRGGREAVLSERSGLIIPIRDSTALCLAIRRLASNPLLRAQMGEEGRRMALERFDARVLFEKIKAEYARLLQEKGLLAPERNPIGQADSC
jgi:glycosyltransferase involved in cell wall biosynthesis